MADHHLTGQPAGLREIGDSLDLPYAKFVAVMKMDIDAAAMLAAKNKSTLNQIRDYQNALCIAEHFFRNTFVRSRHNCL